MNPHIADCRELFLHNLEIQQRLKATTGNELFLEEAVKIGQERGMIFTVDELRRALTLYASTGEGGSPTCGNSFEPPLSPPTADNLMDLVRKSPLEDCSW